MRCSLFGVYLSVFPFASQGFVILDFFAQSSAEKRLAGMYFVYS